MSGSIELCLERTRSDIRMILEACLDGRVLGWQEAISLCNARGRDIHALCLVADELRQQQVGDDVTYVINRNINFTNVCIKNCRFCAFARGVRSGQGYFLPTQEIVNRALQAKEMGATEICIQAGLAPDIEGDTYIKLCKAVKDAVPDLHIHAFSPEEIKYGARLLGSSIRDYLSALRDVGLGSLPGTSAEILDDSLRKRIAPTRISTAEWLEVVSSAHALGISTTSTMMFGHLETAEHRMRHLDLLRSVQRETGGFTEFVPLSFVHAESPLFVKNEVTGVRSGPTGDDVIRLYAVSRLMLGSSIKNIQASWVKEGLRQSQWLLHCGVNDLGGTLMNESISTSAGAKHGQMATPATLRHLIRGAGRIPAQRDTLYGRLQTFGIDQKEDLLGSLDGVEDPDEVFGSYEELSRDERFHYEPRGTRKLHLVH